MLFFISFITVCAVGVACIFLSRMKSTQEIDTQDSPRTLLPIKSASQPRKEGIGSKITSRSASHSLSSCSVGQINAVDTQRSSRQGSFTDINEISFEGGPQREGSELIQPASEGLQRLVCRACNCWFNGDLRLKPLKCVLVLSGTHLRIYKQATDITTRSSKKSSTSESVVYNPSVASLARDAIKSPHDVHTAGFCENEDRLICDLPLSDETSSALKVELSGGWEAYACPDRSDSVVVLSRGGVHARAAGDRILIEEGPHDEIYVADDSGSQESFDKWTYISLGFSSYREACQWRDAVEHASQRRGLSYTSAESFDGLIESLQASEGSEVGKTASRGLALLALFVTRSLYQNISRSQCGFSIGLSLAVIRGFAKSGMRNAQGCIEVPFTSQNTSGASVELLGVRAGEVDQGVNAVAAALRSGRQLDSISSSVSEKKNQRSLTEKSGGPTLIFSVTASADARFALGFAGETTFSLHAETAREVPFLEALIAIHPGTKGETHRGPGKLSVERIRGEVRGRRREMLPGVANLHALDETDQAYASWGDSDTSVERGDRVATLAMGAIPEHPVLAYVRVARLGGDISLGVARGECMWFAFETSPRCAILVDVLDPAVYSPLYACVLGHSALLEVTNTYTRINADAASLRLRLSQLMYKLMFSEMIVPNYAPLLHDRSIIPERSLPGTDAYAESVLYPIQEQKADQALLPPPTAERLRACITSGSLVRPALPETVSPGSKRQEEHTSRDQLSPRWDSAHGRHQTPLGLNASSPVDSDTRNGFRRVESPLAADPSGLAGSGKRFHKGAAAGKRLVVSDTRAATRLDYADDIAAAAAAPPEPAAAAPNFQKKERGPQVALVDELDRMRARERDAQDHIAVLERLLLAEKEQQQVMGISRSIERETVRDGVDATRLHAIEDELRAAVGRLEGTREEMLAAQREIDMEWRKREDSLDTHLRKEYEESQRRIAQVETSLAAIAAVSAPRSEELGDLRRRLDSTEETIAELFKKDMTSKTHSKQGRNTHDWVESLEAASDFGYNSVRGVPEVVDADSQAASAVSYYSSRSRRMSETAHIFGCDISKALEVIKVTENPGMDALSTGDMIIEVDGQPILSLQELLVAAEKKQRSEEITALSVLRGSAVEVITLQ